MKTLISLVFLLHFGFGYSQQLVLDPSLEDTLKCPYTLGRFYHATNTNERYIRDWRSTTLSSSDLHHTCGYNNYQARTGDSYAGIIMYDPAGTREYATALFSSPMIAGECYYVEFYVALRDNCTVGIEQVQAHISDQSIITSAWPPPAPIVVTPHIQAASAQTSGTYQKVSGMYTATGGETTITIGNFNDNNSTNLSPASQFGSVSSYYFVDDVTVTKLDLGPDQAFCDGDSALIVSNVTCPSLTYQWSNGDADTATYASAAGSIQLTVSSNGSSCSMVDDVFINITQPIVDAGSDVTILQGESTTLIASGSTNYSWAPGATLSCINCEDPLATPDSTQTYFVYVTDTNGCSAFDSVTVFVTTVPPPPPPPNNTDPEDEEEVFLFVPNAFTPNSDGINDVFKAEGGPFKEFELLIFDRWGELVFSSHNIDIGWNGLVDGTLAPVEVYVYKINYKTNTTQYTEVYGHATLVR